MSESADLTVEATGETVGEAKWAALRELERASRARQGRGPLRGRRRRASAACSASATSRRACSRICLPRPLRRRARLSRGGGGQAAEARGLVSRIVTELGIDASLDVDEGKDTITVTVSGGDVACSSAATARRSTRCSTSSTSSRTARTATRRRTSSSTPTATASGRRATLETLADEIADRVRESGQAEELEPMTSVERKVVHLRLKEVAGVATASEGTEPNRYVVVLPD